MERDQQFVEMIVKELVEKPEGVKVDRKVDEMGVLITLSVDPSDMGKIIGKEGRTAKAIRTLLRVLGAKHNARVNLKIDEPAGGTGGNGGYMVSDREDSGMGNDASSFNDATATPMNDAPAAMGSFDTPSTPMADMGSTDASSPADVTHTDDTEHPTSIL